MSPAIMPLARMRRITSSSSGCMSGSPPEIGSKPSDHRRIFRHSACGFVPGCSQHVERCSDELFLNEDVIGVEGGNRKDRNAVVGQRLYERKQHSCQRKWKRALKFQTN